MAIIWRWSFDKLVKTIVATLLNKYDFFCVVEGNVGIGKSSLAVTLALKIKREFRRLKKLDYKTIKYYYKTLQFKEKGISEEEFVQYLIELNKIKAYNFTYNKGLIYNKEGLQNFLNGWRGIAICDEMINVAFNRDFFSEEQKNIIKLLNMMRDHNNLTLACVPSFNVLDNQIKNLCKMRLSVVRRGIALIQTQNKTMYSKDKWDTAYNEKIEREWLMKKTKKPQYARLTTFRGLVKFPKLSPSIEAKYQKVKDAKRNKIATEEMGIKFEEEETVEEKLYKRLIDGGIKNMQIIEGVAIANDITSEQLKGRLRRMLEKEGKNTALTSYFWGKKAKEDVEIKGLDWK